MHFGWQKLFKWYCLGKDFDSGGNISSISLFYQIFEGGGAWQITKSLLLSLYKVDGATWISYTNWLDHIRVLFLSIEILSERNCLKCCRFNTFNQIWVKNSKNVGNKKTVLKSQGIWKGDCNIKEVGTIVWIAVCSNSCQIDNYIWKEKLMKTILLLFIP